MLLRRATHLRVAHWRCRRRGVDFQARRRRGSNVATIKNTDVMRVDAPNLSATTFARDFLPLPPAQRRPCVVRGLELGAIDGWTLDSFRQDFGNAHLWDKDQLRHVSVSDYLRSSTGMSTTGGAGNPPTESYLFEFLGHECGDAPSPHAARIVNSYSVPEHVFGPDLWQIGACVRDRLLTLTHGCVALPYCDRHILMFLPHALQLVRLPTSACVCVRAFLRSRVRACVRRACACECVPSCRWRLSADVAAAGASVVARWQARERQWVARRPERHLRVEQSDCAFRIASPRV